DEGRAALAGGGDRPRAAPVGPRDAEVVPVGCGVARSGRALAVGVVGVVGSAEVLGIDPDARAGDVAIAVPSLADVDPSGTRSRRWVDGVVGAAVELCRRSGGPRDHDVVGGVVVGAGQPFGEALTAVGS